MKIETSELKGGIGQRASHTESPTLNPCNKIHRQFVIGLVFSERAVKNEIKLCLIR